MIYSSVALLFPPLYEKRSFQRSLSKFPSVKGRAKSRSSLAGGDGGEPLGRRFGQDVEEATCQLTCLVASAHSSSTPGRSAGTRRYASVEGRRAHSDALQHTSSL